jgi:hypothetical protein
VRCVDDAHPTAPEERPDDVPANAVARAEPHGIDISVRRAVGSGEATDDRTASVARLEVASDLGPAFAVVELEIRERYERLVLRTHHRAAAG